MRSLSSGKRTNIIQKQQHEYKIDRFQSRIRESTEEQIKEEARLTFQEMFESLIGSICLWGMCYGKNIGDNVKRNGVHCSLFT